MTQSLLPQEFLESVKPILGDSYPAFLDSYQRPHQRAVRLSGRRKQTFADYPGQAVPWQQGAFLIDQDSRMGAHPLHWAGAYYLQDASAMAAVAALSPCPGEKVLDLCAAPGGKASQIADDLKGILRDIRSEHRPDTMTADEISLAATMQDQLQDAMNFEGSSEEKKAKALLATLGIDYDAITMEQFVNLIEVLKLSKHLKTPISQRGKTAMTHGKGKRKKH